MQSKLNKIKFHPLDEGIHKFEGLCEDGGAVSSRAKSLSESHNPDAGI